MREAVIVSYARTGLAKSVRGGFNITPPMTMAAHAIKHAVERAGVEKDYVEDCYLGNCAHGARNIGREAALLVFDGNRGLCRGCAGWGSIRRGGWRQGLCDRRRGRLEIQMRFIGNLMGKTPVPARSKDEQYNHGSSCENK